VKWIGLVCDGLDGCNWIILYELDKWSGLVAHGMDCIDGLGLVLMNWTTGLFFVFVFRMDRMNEIELVWINLMDWIGSPWDGLDARNLIGFDGLDG